MLCLFLCMCVHISMASSVSASMLPYKLFYDMSIWPVFAVITAGYIWSISLPFMTCLIWTVSLPAMTSIEYNLPSRTIYDLPSIYDLHCCCLLWTHTLTETAWMPCAIFLPCAEMRAHGKKSLCRVPAFQHTAKDPLPCACHDDSRQICKHTANVFKKNWFHSPNFF